MKKLLIGFVSACALLGSASAMANESACNQIAKNLERGQFPNKIEKHTIRQKPEVEYQKKSSECLVVLNYDFDIHKFAEKIAEIAPKAMKEESVKEVALYYVLDKNGERAIKQLIQEEYSEKYKKLMSIPDVVVKFRANFYGHDELDIDYLYFTL